MPKPRIIHRVENTDDPRPVMWPGYGLIGALYPEMDRDRLGWRAKTASGAVCPRLGTQEYGVGWLRIQADPSLTYRPAQRPPAADPVLELVARLLGEGDRSRAEAAVLACIAKEIRDMRDARSTKSPPALWHHLDQFSTWLAALNGEAVQPSRVVDILSATRRRTR